MKNLLFLLLLIPIMIFGQSQKTVKLIEEIKGQYNTDEYGNITYTKVVELPGMTKDQIFSAAQNYFAYRYKDAQSVIQKSDKDEGVIIGKGLFLDVYSAMDFSATNYFSVWHLLRIDAKDGKMRVILTLTDYYKKSKSSGQWFYETDRIFEHYPFSDKGDDNMYGKAFYNAHQKAVQTMESIDKSIREGNTTKDAEKKDW
jgi:hypothetical protein